MKADGTKIAERCIMDFPEAFKFIDETAPDKETHHPKCSYRQAGMLCDCSIIWAEYHKRRANQAEGRERKLLASLADSDTVHANILRGTIALTKAQAIHIAGLPADIEERERVLTQAATAAQKLADAMETCHECNGTVLVEEQPTHCEDCSWDCDSHEGAECATLYGLHLELKRKLAALATPAPEQPAEKGPVSE